MYTRTVRGSTLDFRLLQVGENYSRICFIWDEAFANIDVKISYPLFSNTVIRSNIKTNLKRL